MRMVFGLQIIMKVVVMSLEVAQGERLRQCDFRTDFIIETDFNLFGLALGSELVQ